jgi:hypothetical protein
MVVLGTLAEPPRSGCVHAARPSALRALPHKPVRFDSYVHPTSFRLQT